MSRSWFRWLAFAVCALLIVVCLGVLVMGALIHEANFVNTQNSLKLLSLILEWRYQAGSLPPAYVIGKDGKPSCSWRTLILPYIYYGHLYDAYNLSEPWNSPNNRKLQRPIGEFIAADGDGVPARTNFVAVVGKDTLWPGPVGAKPTPAQWASGKVLLVELAHSDIEWMEPRDITLDELMAAVKTHSVEKLLGTKKIVAVDSRAEILLIDPNDDPETIRSMFTLPPKTDAPVPGKPSGGAK